MPRKKTTLSGIISSEDDDYSALTLEVWSTNKIAKRPLAQGKIEKDGNFEVPLDNKLLHMSGGKSREAAIIKVRNTEGETIAEHHQPLKSPLGRSAPIHIDIPISKKGPQNEEITIRVKLLDPITGKPYAPNSVQVGTTVSPRTKATIAKSNLQKLSASGEFIINLDPSFSNNQQAEKTETIQAVVVGKNGNEVAQAQINIGSDIKDGAQLTARARVVEKANLSLSQVCQAANIKVSAQLKSYFTRRKLTSISDLRRVGDLKKLKLSTSSLILGQLQAQVDLSIISPDPFERETLHRKGFSTPLSIARQLESKFVTEMAPNIGGNERALEIHRTAKIRSNLAHQIAVGIKADQANRYKIANKDSLGEDQDWFKCEDFQTALSPIAYLADLVRYTLEHVTKDGSPITLEDLEATFHQPFASLAASYETSEQEIPQVKLCTEILQRLYLATLDTISPAKRKKLSEDKKGYLKAAYDALLLQIGTSEEELKRAQHASPEERTTLANRLGIPSKLVSSSSHVDPLKELLFSEDELNDLVLKEVFGYPTSDETQTESFKPKIIEWRLTCLRDSWYKQDWPEGELPPCTPLIDPDVIGPNDFRSLKWQEFDLWERRRRWVDEQLGRLRNIQSSGPDSRPETRIENTLASLYKEWLYTTTSDMSVEEVRQQVWAPTTPVSDFTTLWQKITEGTEQEINSTLQRIKQDLCLSRDAFVRLMVLSEKCDYTKTHGQGDLSELEWRELNSILVQAIKTRFFLTWCNEEGQQDIQHLPGNFWHPASEPQTGIWNPLPEGNLWPAPTPWIDPDIVGLADLPEGEAGTKAKDLWLQRLTTLEQLREEQRTTRLTQGLAAALRQAVGHPNPGDPLPHDLERLAHGLASSDPLTADAARQKIQTEFFVYIDEFSSIFRVLSKDSKASDSERTEFDRILYLASKRKRWHSIWSREETSSSQPTVRWYWFALKHKLDPWLAPVGSRAIWREALRQSMRPPLIDPDQIFLSDIKNLTDTDAVHRLWHQRHDQIVNMTEQYLSLRRGRKLPNVLRYLIKLNYGSDVFPSIMEQEAAGQRIESRLTQLHLSFAGYRKLIQLYHVDLDDNTASDRDWDDMFSIFLQVWKKTVYPYWRKQEKAEKFIVSPDYFERTNIAYSFLHKWRASTQYRQDFENLLRTRSEQEAALLGGIKNAIETVEKSALPILRDAFIQALEKEEAPFEVKAKNLSQHLLISMHNAGCRLTTRLGQAIDTIQSLLRGLRGKQITITHPNINIQAPDFDLEWKWLGSFDIWRSVQFVHIYPENFLYPTLLRGRTRLFDLARPIAKFEHFNIEHETKKVVETILAEKDEHRSIRVLDLCTCEALCASKDTGATEVQRICFMFGSRNYWSAFAPSLAHFNTSITGWRRAHAQEKYIVEDNMALAASGGYLYLIVWYTSLVKFRRISLTDFVVLDAEQILTESFLNGWEEDVHLDFVDEYQKYFKNAEIVQTCNRKRHGPIDLIGWTDQGGMRFRIEDGKWLEPRSIPLPVNDTQPLKGRLVAALASDSITNQFIIRIQDHAQGLWLCQYRNNEFIDCLNIEIDVSSRRIFGLDVFCVVREENEIRNVDVLVLGTKENSSKGATRISSDKSITEYSSVPSDIFKEYTKPQLWDHFVVQQRSIRVGNIRSFHAEALTKVHFENDAVCLEYIAYLTDTINLRNWSEFIFEPTMDLVGAILPIPSVWEQLEISSDENWRILRLLAEDFYFNVPMLLALTLQNSGLYDAALKWYRFVYNYTLPINERKIFPGLIREEAFFDHIDSVIDWRDPINPHNIAKTRKNAYTRFTLISILRCLVEYADSEFARDTPESLSIAQSLYQTAEDLFETPELAQDPDPNKELIRNLSSEVNASDLRILWPRIGSELESAFSSGSLRKSVDQIRSILQVSRALSEQTSKTFTILHKERNSSPPTLGQLINNNIIHSDKVIRMVFRDDSNYQLVASSVARGSIRNKSSTPVSIGLCFPPNPVVNALRLHVELSLRKLRTCRNIAGMQRPIETHSTSTETTTDMPKIGPGGQIVLPGIHRFAPTPYHYKTLIERARQLVSQAQQMESLMWNALQGGEEAQFRELQGRQAVEVARASVRLQALNSIESQANVTLVGLEQQSAYIRVSHFNSLISADLNEWERISRDLTATIAGIYSAGAAGLAVASIFAGPQAAAKSAELMGQASQTWLNYFREMGAYERRKQDWLFQQQLAAQEIQIGSQRIAVAQARVDVSNQEREIAELHLQNNKAALEFLKYREDNKELFYWMAGVLSNVYAYFLQQATAMAMTAAAQLGFERQEPAPDFIQTDYWQENGNVLNAVSSEDKQHRHGLTGSARLLRDIEKLDLYAFSTDVRRLNLTRSISIAALFPEELERLRRSGVMSFATPMEMFDRDHPGHYLRLIHRVRTSVVALVPPTSGIHASLCSIGRSWVVVGGDIFQRVPIERPPEEVALSSPAGDAGVFELDPQGELRRPFEGLGVDTTWEFRMPKAANRFDYRSIADVVITIEYTARSSYDYRDQVIAQLSPDITADRAFSLRYEFPDAWYELNNPESSDLPLTVRFSTSQTDFPPNMSRFRVKELTLFFSRMEGATFDVKVKHFHFYKPDNPSPIGGSARTVNGLISTRHGNGATWSSIQGEQPFGTWELALEDSPELRERFRNEEILDVLFVLTYRAEVPSYGE